MASFQFYSEDYALLGNIAAADAVVDTHSRHTDGLWTVYLKDGTELRAGRVFVDDGYIKVWGEHINSYLPEEIRAVRVELR